MLGSIRAAVLKNLRIPASLPSQQALAPTFSQIISRGFAGGFLDKDKVTERVLYVTKHFDKVDPNKVGVVMLYTGMLDPIDPTETNHV